MEEINLSIQNINKRYEDHIIFKNFNIDFKVDKINCIVGKSGCGKSTLLNIISGIIKNDTEVFKTVEDIGVSYIFQEDRLIDWLTVEDNIKIVASKHYGKDKLENICDNYLNLVGIKEYKKYYPQMLSGGIRQRVNIARAFIYPSKIIIMDEPFKSIDIKNKMDIMKNLKEILSKDKRTVIFVTHDIDEAMFLSDYIYIVGDKPLKIKKVFKNNEKIEKSDISLHI